FCAKPRIRKYMSENDFFSKFHFLPVRSISHFSHDFAGFRHNLKVLGCSNLQSKNLKVGQRLGSFD
ncbi:MAG TPA: hypothetical protein VLE70_03420, partial [Anaerolineae bacterium]|nr:hypothetical protein [Anaerolineae bacterium]